MDKKIQKIKELKAEIETKNTWIDDLLQEVQDLKSENIELHHILKSEYEECNKCVLKNKCLRKGEC